MRYTRTGRATYQRSCRESGQGLICCENQRYTGDHNEKKVEWIRDDGNGLPVVLGSRDCVASTCVGRIDMRKETVLGTLVVGFKYTAIASITIAVIMTVKSAWIKFLCFWLSLCFL